MLENTRSQLSNAVSHVFVRLLDQKLQSEEKKRPNEDVLSGARNIHVAPDRVKNATDDIFTKSFN